jgi:3-dehydroquinate synthase
LIDPKVLDTLSARQFNNGIAEMIKYGMIKSRHLFDDLKTLDIKDNIGYYIYQSLLIKKELVEKDEFDEKDRHLLNFGHTFGHAYEAFYKYSKYLHGEAVGLGMLLMVDKEIKNDLKEVLSKYSLPTEDQASKVDLLEFVKLDKKAQANGISVVMVDKIGEAYIIKKQIEEL